MDHSAGTGVAGKAEPSGFSETQPASAATIVQASGAASRRRLRLAGSGEGLDFWGIALWLPVKADAGQFIVIPHDVASIAPG